MWDFLKDPLGLMDDAPAQTEAQGTAKPGPSLTDKAKSAVSGIATGAVVNNLPGAGKLYSYDADGLRLAPMTQIALSAMAVYGLFRLVGGR